MHSELKHILGALFYAFVYFASPIACGIGVVISGYVGAVICLLSIASMSIGYVWAGLQKVPATPKEAAVEMLFWFISGSCLVCAIAAVINKSFSALAMLLISSGSLLLVWRQINESIRARIKRAPII